MPTPAHSRGKRQKPQKAFLRQAGFTIIELMIAVGILAVLVSLALPSYRLIIEKRQVSSGAEQIGAFLSAAQLEALKRNRFVAVAFSSSASGWCLGSRESLEASDLDDISGCDCTVTDAAAATACALDDALSVLSSTSLSYPDVLESASLGDGAGYFVFDPIRGLMVNLSQSSEVALTSDNQHYAMNVQVIPTGRVKLCTDTTRGEMAVPGYGTC